MKLQPCGGRVAASFLIFASLSINLSHAAQVKPVSSLRGGSGPGSLAATSDAVADYANASAAYAAIASASLSQEAGRCSLLGGLVSPNVSARCCQSVQVATQRGLSSYGMAQPCKDGWRCEADGVTPEADFEDQARKELCSEPKCLADVATAMRNSWKTAKAAEYMATICNGGVVTVDKNGTKDGLIRTYGGAMGRPLTRRRRSGTNGANGTNGTNKTMDKVESPMCFPGEALVQVYGRGSVPIASLKPGEQVLVAKPEVGAPLLYQPVLDWIHLSRGTEAAYTTVRHEHGILRASAGHLVFAINSANGDPKDVPAGILRKGDFIFAMPSANSTDSGLIASKVLSIEHGSISLGMYAPLTSQGTIVVDGVLASNYATPSLNVRLPHWLAHAGLFPLRAFHSLGLHGIFAAAYASLVGDFGVEGAQTEVVDIMHPYFSFLYHGLRMDRMLQSA